MLCSVFFIQENSNDYEKKFMSIVTACSDVEPMYCSDGAHFGVG